MFNQVKGYLMIGVLFIIGSVVAVGFPIFLTRYEWLNNFLMMAVLIGSLVMWAAILFSKFQDSHDSLKKNLLLLPWRCMVAYFKFLKLWFKSLPYIVIYFVVCWLSIELTFLTGIDNPMEKRTTFLNDCGLVIYFFGFQLVIIFLFVKLFDRKQRVD